uniref:Uncharacterized protein n=1 Tax=Arundo donax TaxID=35708 RepID=A0A0A9DRG9_ARUDO
MMQTLPEFRFRNYIFIKNRNQLKLQFDSVNAFLHTTEVKGKIISYIGNGSSVHTIR